MYKYANKEQTAVNDIVNNIKNICPGTYRWRIFLEWLKEGGVPEVFETSEEAAIRLAKEEAEALTTQELLNAKSYPKLQALASMTPTQVKSWVDTNITNFAEAKDAIKTLAIAVSILARRL